MKAFLMHRDRDFDPQLLLSRRERERGWRHTDENALRLEHLLPWNQADLRRDLGLDIVFGAMAQGDEFLIEAAQVAVLSSLTDSAAILYRQDALADCLANVELVRRIYQIAIDAIKAERKNYWGSFGRYPGGTLHRAVDVLQIFVGALRQLRDIADQHGPAFKSEAFSRLFAMLRQELCDDYFVEIEDHLRRLKFRAGVLISAKLGKGSQGRDYVLRKPNEDRRSWVGKLIGEKPPSYTYQLPQRDDAGAQALSLLRDRGVNLVANALAQSTDHILSFFQMLRTELGFYIGCLNLRMQLTQLDEPICWPVCGAAGDRTLSFSGLYDLSLALSAGRKVVSNGLRADGKHLVIVTGANTGGKSTFLRSIGLAQLMMQAGMFVAAQALTAEMCRGLFTHYRREEDAAMESGKWDEELSRMSEIVDRTGPDSLMLFNESFASTNEREGAEIASQIVRALLDRRIRVFFVTHLYHFAHSFAAQQPADAVFLRAERHPDGTRPFKLIEAEPLETSYGEDLYRTVFAGDTPPTSGPLQVESRHCHRD